MRRRKKTDITSLRQSISLSATALLAMNAIGFSTIGSADVVTSDDAIIIGSACIGPACVDGEDFGLELLRLKGNNTQIKFDDTSNTASFPNTDWQLTTNSTENGGANKFSIDNVTLGTVPFTISGGAGNNALFVNNSGNVGVGTATPAVEIHIADGDSPSVRLEQDASNGFTPQVWDIAGNESNFFIRDITNASRLPFRIRPGAPTSAIDVSANGDIAMGFSGTPVGSLHIRRAGAVEPSLILESAASLVRWEIKANATTGRMTFKNLNGTTGPGGGPTTPFKFSPTAVENLLRVGIPNDNEVTIAGNLVISGDCSEQNGACADYVFDESYELRTLDQLEAFISENKHLPNVPSAEYIETNGIDMAHFSGRLLEKVEELTLYTLQQQEIITALTERLSRLEDHGK